LIYTCGYRSILFFLYIYMFAAPAYAVSVPLEVFEALRLKGSGINRTFEPLTVGIPLPDDSGISSVNQLGLSGVSAGQFRPLAYHKNGNIKWVLIDTQVDVPADGKNSSIVLVDGRGNFGGQNLAAEDRDYIYVNTGPAQFTIRKRGFNLFDKVTIESQQIINQGGSSGIRITGMDGKIYLASNDEHTNVAIEENGPVKTVIKALGAHYSSDGNRMMDFTVRMYFYKEKGKVRVSYTLRNASKSQIEIANIKSLDLISKISPGRNLKVRAATHNGFIEDVLMPDDSMIFYQAHSMFPQESTCDGFAYKMPLPYYGGYVKGVWKGSYAHEGYRIKKNGRTVASGNQREYHDISYLDLSDASGRGVTVGVRFASAYWPKSLRAKGDNTIEVGLYPEEVNDIDKTEWINSLKGLGCKINQQVIEGSLAKKGYWFRFGSHETFDIMYDFHLSRTDPADEMKRFQYRLFGRAPVDWYNKNVEGIDPLYHFISRSAEEKYAADNSWVYNMGLRGDGELKILKCHYWGNAGYNNQHDQARINLVNSWKDDKDIARAGKYYLEAELLFNYNNDWSVRHSDDYNFENLSKDGFPAGPKLNTDKVWNWKTVFEDEHFHWYGLPLYYYATGEERIKDSIMDFGEYIKYKNKKLNFNFMRVTGWGFYSLAAMYDFTGDKEYMDIADNNFSLLLKGSFKQPSGTLFLDWNRGFVGGGQSGKYDVKTFMHSYIMYDGLLNYYLHMQNKNPIRERVRDVLEGMSEFTRKELFREDEKYGHWRMWMPFIYYIYNPAYDYAHDNTEKSIKEAFNSYTQPYLFNGGQEWIDIMKKSYKTTVRDWYGYQDHPGFQKMAYALMHQKADSTPPAQISGLKVLTESNCTLSWDNATDRKEIHAYQIKYSTKIIIENLNFNVSSGAFKYENPQEYSKTFQFNPDNYTNWWAAENVFDEPSHDSHGQYVVKNLSSGKYYFAIRSWDTNNNRSPISSLLQIEIDKNGSCKQINTTTQYQ